MQKPQWTRNGKKLETIPAWQLEKVKSKEEVILEAQTDKKKVHFATLMDIRHLKNAELEPKLQKYKGRIVLRGDIEKDGSGAYSVFTEQGLSASQKTAAKVIDVITRLPDCDGQAADAVICLHPSKIGGHSKIIENSNIGMSRTYGYFFHDTTCRSLGQTLKILWHLLDDISMDIH